MNRDRERVWQHCEESIKKDSRKWFVCKTRKMCVEGQRGWIFRSCGERCIEVLKVSKLL